MVSRSSTTSSRRTLSVIWSRSWLSPASTSETTLRRILRRLRMRLIPFLFSNFNQSQLVNIDLRQVRSGGRPSVLSDNGSTPAGGGGPGQPSHLVYLERLKKLRAAGGLSQEAGSVDQENVENYSKTSSAYSSSGKIHHTNQP